MNTGTTPLRDVSTHNKVQGPDDQMCVRYSELLQMSLFTLLRVAAMTVRKKKPWSFTNVRSAISSQGSDAPFSRVTLCMSGGCIWDNSCLPINLHWLTYCTLLSSFTSSTSVLTQLCQQDPLKANCSQSDREEHRLPKFLTCRCVMKYFISRMFGLVI